MTTKNFNLPFTAFSVVSSAVLLLYVIVRAYCLSFTHDESLSFTIVQGNNVWSDTANNHLFNTVLMSWSSSIFGFSELALRLPNVFAFLAYLIGGFLIFRASKKLLLSIFGFVLITLNPFLLEFFSLSRGYGLSLGFMMLSLYHIISNSDKDEIASTLPLNFALASAYSALSMYANLSLINFAICVPAVFLIKYLMVCRTKGSNLKLHLAFWGILMVHAVPILLGVQRLLKLKELGQLYFGADSLIGGFEALIFSSMMHIEAGVSLTVAIIKGLLAMFLFSGVILVVTKKLFSGRLFLLLCLISILTLGILMEGMLFEAKYPTSRTALFFIPLMGVYIFQLLVDLIEHYHIDKRLYTTVILILSLPIVVNFIADANLTHSKTWKYDAHTKDAMQIVRDRLQNTDHHQVISNHWLFEPSINYYIDRWNLKLHRANRDGVNLNSDFIYRLEDNSELEGFEILCSYKDIKSDLLIKVD